jgi:LacI family transcriptional regulator
MTKSNRTTLKDVSLAAGVSVMTVSNVIRGRSGAVSDKTRAKVEKEIKRLNYRPNVSAQNLRASASRSIGMVISDDDPEFLSDPFISQLVSGLSNVLSANDYSLDIQGIVPDRFEHANILSKASNDALCAILCGSERERQRNVDFLKSINQPTVVFQEPVRVRGADIAIIRQEDEGAGRELGTHLVARKVKKVLFVRSSTDWPAIEQRERGLRRAFDEAGRKINCETIEAISENFDDVQDAVKQYLAHSKVDAIVGATDPMGIAAMRVCETLDFNVPRDIKVAGFNGFLAWKLATPTLTTVLSPAYEMGRRAGEVLLERLNTGQFERKNIVFPTQLLVGDST